MDFSTVYLFLSEGETSVDTDFDLLLSRGILSKDDLEDSVIVCISRDYLDQPYKAPVIRIIDRLSSVFAPDWRINSIRYPMLDAFRYLPGDEIPTLRVIVKDRELYEDLDYFLHLSNFENRFKTVVPTRGKHKGFSEVKSQVFRQDVADLGKFTLALTDIAGYPDGVNGPIPGWVFQPANNWLTRVLDLYDVQTSMSSIPDRMTTLKETTKAAFKADLENPVINLGPMIGEDIRNCIIESFESRQQLLELSRNLLDRL